MTSNLIKNQMCELKESEQAKPRASRKTTRPRSLLKLGFFVVNVLASNWIKFLDQHFLRHVALVLGRCVEVTRSSAGLELDLFAYTFCHVGLL